MCLLKFNFFLFPLWQNSQWLSDKVLACNAGDLGSIPGLGKPPGGGHGNPLQYFHPGNPVDRGGSRAAVRGVTKSRTQQKQQSAQAGTRTAHEMARFSLFKWTVQWHFVHLHRCTPTPTFHLQNFLIITNCNCVPVSSDSPASSPQPQHSPLSL